MSDEGFLKRWSRRKRAETAPPDGAPAERIPAAGPAEPARADAPLEPAPPPGAAPAKPEDEPVDPATLPPLESLGPDSDYTVFLKKGVPEALRTAALRRAWITDPAIRDFPSPAVDYAWDFNAPEFALRPTDNVEKMLDRIFPPKAADAAEAPPPPAGPAPAETPAVESAPADALSLPQKQAEAGGTFDEVKPAVTEASAPRRKHGGALPE